jgi:WD40 repeat protein
VNAVVFSPDGTMALSASDDSRLILWNIETGETIREFVGHSGSVTSVDFSPDGLTAISGTNGGAIYLWDVARGERLRRFEAFNWVVAVAYLPNGKQILSLAGDGRVAISQAHIPNPELIDWVQSNRYLATLSCEDRLRYYLISECEEIQP